MNLAIFGLEFIDTYRYNQFLLEDETFRKNINSITVFHEDSPSEKTYHQLGKVSSKFHTIRSRFLSEKKIKSKLNEFQIDFLIINSFTVSDLFFLKLVLNEKVYVLYIQHGLYLSYMKRNTSFYFNNLQRIISTLYQVSIVSNYNLFKAWNIIKIYTSDNDRCHIPLEIRSRANSAIVFSDFWKKWHYNTYKLKIADYQVIGNTDLLKYMPKHYSNSIVYCTQTLVEDGRISRMEMNNFYKELNSFAKRMKKSVVVKVHPRNDSTTRSILKNHKFMLEEINLPIGDVVIGHYSSLLPSWSMFGSPIIVREIENHKTPYEISEIASIIFSNLDNINSIEPTHLIPKRKEAIHLFGGTPELKTIIHNTLNEYENTILPSIN